ncbi:MAG: hypothetical protein ACYTG5_06885 [Planctomycetota bacterium]|jgi:hypothetical protein
MQFSRLLALSLALAIPTSIVAQDDSPKSGAALVGTWNLAATTVAGKSEWQMIVAEDMTTELWGESVKGSASKIALKGDKLSFLLELAPEDGKGVELAFAGKMEEDSFKGTLSLPGLGDIAKVSASKAPEVDLTPLVGKWKMVSESEMGSRTSSMVIKADGTGSADFGEFGKFALDYVDLQGDALGWGINADFGGQQVYLEFEGKLEGTRFSGSLWAGDMEIASVTGTKQ